MPELSLYRLRVLGAQGTPDVLELRSASAVDALQQAARLELQRVRLWAVLWQALLVTPLAQDAPVF